MVRLRILSDLHLEFAPWNYVPIGEDIVILAGDIADFSRKGRSRREALWRDIGRGKVQAIYVIGNHEGYGSCLPQERVIASIRSELPSFVHLLEREVIEVDGIRFLGCPLWTDFSYLQAAGSASHGKSAKEIGEYSAYCISDFTALCDRTDSRGQACPIGPENMSIWHKRDRLWLSDAIGLSAIPTVVITHFLPHLKSINAQYSDNLLNAYFAADCTDLLKKPVRLWVHGHTHSSCDYLENGTRVVCNPRGYHLHGIRENRDFQPGLLVEVLNFIE